MHRLNGLEGGFLSVESDFQPTNSLALFLVRPAVGPDGTTQPLTFAGLRAHVERRLPVLPSFRWRVAPVPFGLAQPVMYEDPTFDLDFHLRHRTLAAPGTSAQLDRLIGDIAERHLDRRHPLWQITLIDGLADGRQAVLFKAQHALLDGVGLTTTVARLLTDEHWEVPAGTPEWRAERRPSSIRLLAGAAVDGVRSVRRLPDLARRTRAGRRAKQAYLAQSPVHVPNPLRDAPPCSLNDAYTVARVYSRASLALADVKFVKDVAGVSLNDVVLAVCAGALRDYLLARDDLPKRALVANVPVSTEPADSPGRQYGNRFANIAVTLATDEADPWARLRRISEVSAVAKQALDLLGADMLVEWLDYAPPALARAAVHTHVALKKRNPDKGNFSIAISNIKGPARTRSFGAAGVEEVYLTGPPSYGVGSNVTLWSYGDRLWFSNLAFADSLTHPDELMADLPRALAELVDLARARRDERVIGAFAVPDGRTSPPEALAGFEPSGHHPRR